MTMILPGPGARPVALRRRHRDLTPVLIALAWASVGALGVSLLTPQAAALIPACPIVSLQP